MTLRKILLPLILVMASLCCSVMGQRGAKLPLWDFKPAEKNPIQNSICRVFVSDPSKGQKWMGTGWVAGRSHIVTCWHVATLRGTRDKVEIELEFTLLKKNIKATLVKADKAADIAILKCEVPKECSVLRFAESEVPAGSKVDWIGMAGERGDLPRHATNNFKIKNTDGYDDREVQVFTSIYTQGDSGGPILNSKNEVVGVNCYFTVPVEIGYPHDPFGGAKTGVLGCSPRLAPMREFAKEHIK